VAVVEALIAADAVVNIRTESGMDHYQPTPLHDAARAGHADVLVLLLDAGALVDAELSVSDSSGLTALAIAAGEGHVDAVRVLIKRGANIEGSGGYHTPLFQAVDGDQVEVVEALIDSGADVNAGEDGLTPLRSAKSFGRRERVQEVLRAHGAVE